MNREIVWTSQFKKDYKAAMKRSLNMSLIDDCIRMLAAREELAPKFRDHDLSGNWVGHRECHIQPDWLMLTDIEFSDLTQTAPATNTK